MMMKGGGNDPISKRDQRILTGIPRCHGVLTMMIQI